MQEVFWLDHALAVPNDYKVGKTPVLNSKFNMNRSTIFGQSVLGHSIFSRLAIPMDVEPI